MQRHQLTPNQEIKKIYALKAQERDRLTRSKKN